MGCTIPVLELSNCPALSNLDCPCPMRYNISRYDSGVLLHVGLAYAMNSTELNYRVAM
jgi:hypothetical protein